MRTPPFCLALALAGFAPVEASSQRLAPSLGLYVTPPSPVALRQPVTLGVRLATTATTYRYVATMQVTGAWLPAVSAGCAAPQVIGTGSRIRWIPASGTYRVTVHSLSRAKGRDSSSLSYEVTAPNAGWLNISVTQIPQPNPPGNLTLTLSTNDRGPGHAYEWRARVKSVTTSHVTDYSGGSPGPTISVPLILTPGHYNVTARVGVHTGNPCQIIQVSDGVLNDQVVR